MNHLGTEWISLFWSRKSMEEGVFWGKIIENFGFPKLGTPGSPGIAPEVSEMDCWWNSTGFRAQELPLTPSELEARSKNLQNPRGSWDFAVVIQVRNSKEMSRPGEVVLLSRYNPKPQRKPRKNQNRQKPILQIHNYALGVVHTKYGALGCPLTLQTFLCCFSERSCTFSRRSCTFLRHSTTGSLPNP